MKATRVAVGQVRDVASGADAKNGVKRYARVVEIIESTGVAYITNLDGKNRRAKDLSQLARCRIVPPEEVAS